MKLLLAFAAALLLSAACGTWTANPDSSRLDTSYGAYGAGAGAAYCPPGYNARSDRPGYSTNVQRPRGVRTTFPTAGRSGTTFKRPSAAVTPRRGVTRRAMPKMRTVRRR